MSSNIVIFSYNKHFKLKKKYIRIYNSFFYILIFLFVLFIFPPFFIYQIKIRSAQSLLTLISELKQSILIYDYKSLNSGILSRIETIEQEKSNICDMLMSLQSDIRNNLKELEDVHYSSISFDMEESKNEKETMENNKKENENNEELKN